MNCFRLRSILKNLSYNFDFCVSLVAFLKGGKLGMCLGRKKNEEKGQVVEVEWVRAVFCNKGRLVRVLTAPEV